MKQSKFSEEQIVRILKAVEAGTKVAETCRKHGISEPTHYVWKSKYANVEVSARRADRTLGSSRSACHYRHRPHDATPLMAVIEAHLKDNPGHGFDLSFDQALHQP